MNALAPASFPTGLERTAAPDSGPGAATNVDQGM